MYWKVDKEFFDLPDNVKEAVTGAKHNAKHSEFYLKLKSLNSKIDTYRGLFYQKVPSY